MERPTRDPHDPRWHTPPKLWDKLKPKARAMRTAQTPAEVVLWQRLRARKLGVKFRRQHTVGQFIVDFYCAEAQLVVEVDGATHAASVHQDQARDEIIRSLGMHVLRFKNEDVLHNMEAVLTRIGARLAAPSQ